MFLVSSSFRSASAGMTRKLRKLYSPSSSALSSILNQFGSSSSSTTTTAAGAADDAVRRLELRVGRVVDVWVHPQASGLYIEKVDLGDSPASKDVPNPRTIVSGLVQFCKPESLLNRKVVVVCNLKPRDFKGVLSHGMLLCSSNSEHSKVEPILPHESSPEGELIKIATRTGTYLGRA